MTKKLLMAMSVLASLLTTSCKDETCAKCELRLYCATCDYGSSETDVCDVEGTDSFESACISAGGVFKKKSDILQDTRELCDEESSVVNDFMDEKVAMYYKCQYVD